MALMKCPDCGTEISNQATVCPKCARPLKEKAGWDGFRMSGLILGIFFLVLYFSGFLFGFPFDTLILGGVLCVATLVVTNNVARAVCLGILAVSTGFFHVVQTGDFITIVPKASFSYADTFVSLSAIEHRLNNPALPDAFHEDPQFDHLVRALRDRGYITFRKRTWSEIDEEVRRLLPDR